VKTKAGEAKDMAQEKAEDVKEKTKETLGGGMKRSRSNERAVDEEDADEEDAEKPSKKARKEAGAGRTKTADMATKGGQAGAGMNSNVEDEGAIATRLRDAEAGEQGQKRKADGEPEEEEPRATKKPAH